MTPRSRGKSLGNRIGPHAAAVLVYGLLALWLTRPLVAHLDSALPGATSDALVHYWNGWWVRQALLSGRSFLHSDLIFYPEGASLLYHNVAWLNIVPWLALQTFLEDQIAYNLVFLGNLVLGAYATFLLTRRLSGSALAAFLAGALYMAWPYRMSQLDHPNLISTAWIPLFFLFFIRAVGEGRRRYGILAGLFLALVGYARWQLLIPAAVMIAAYLLGTLPDWLRSRRKWSAGLLTAATAVLLLAPPVLLLFQQQQETAQTFDSLLREGEETVMSTDLLAFLTPPDDHPLFGEAAEAAYDGYYPDRSELRRFTTFVGFSALLLALLGVWQRRRDSLPWLLMAVALSLLALGPVLRLNGRFLEEVPTLYGLTEPLLVFRLLRVPERFNIALALPVAVLVSFGVTALLDKVPAIMSRLPGRRYVVTAALALVILFEYNSGPASLRKPKTPAFYTQLAADSGGAVLDLPIDALKAKENMFAQTVHGRPLVHGKIARLPHGVYAFIDEHPWLRIIRQSGEMPSWLTDVSTQLNSLADEGIDYIILHKDQITPERLARWRRYLAMQTVFEDKRIAVMRTRPEAGQDFALLAELQPGIGPVQTLLTGDCFESGRPMMEVDVAWGTRESVPGGWPVLLTLENAAGEAVQEWSFAALDDRPADSLKWGYYPLELVETLEPGEYELFLSLPDEAAAGRMRVGAIELSEGACPLELPEDSQVADALFGDSMRLLGYQVDRPSSERLAVTLYWRSEQRVDTDYKVFVHVFEPASKVPVAQDDAMPRRGTYPTRFWAPGEIVVDEISISLEDVPGGEYGIAVGVYDPATNERLAALTRDGWRAAEGRLELPGQVVKVSEGE